MNWIVMKKHVLSFACVIFLICSIPIYSFCEGFWYSTEEGEKIIAFDGWRRVPICEEVGDYISVADLHIKEAISVPKEGEDPIRKWEKCAYLYENDKNGAQAYIITYCNRRVSALFAVVAIERGSKKVEAVFVGDSTMILKTLSEKYGSIQLWDLERQREFDQVYHSMRTVHAVPGKTNINQTMALHVARQYLVDINRIKPNEYEDGDIAFSYYDNGKGDLWVVLFYSRDKEIDYQVEINATSGEILKHYEYR